MFYDAMFAVGEVDFEWDFEEGSDRCMIASACYPRSAPDHGCDGYWSTPWCTCDPEDEDENCGSEEKYELWLKKIINYMKDLGIKCTYECDSDSNCTIHTFSWEQKA